VPTRREAKDGRAIAVADAGGPRVPPAPIRVLLIEDDAMDAELIVRYLQSGGILCEWLRVETEIQLRGALRQFKPMVILSDFTLPQFDGLSACTIAQELSPHVPFILVSGTIGEERAVEMIKRGASNYVLKSNLPRLAPIVVRALEEGRARAERSDQEADIARLTRVLRMLSGINGLVIRVRDRDELLREACRVAVSIGGYATAIVTLRDPGSGVTRPVASAGADEKITGMLRDSLIRSDGRPNSIIAGVLKTGTAFICNDTIDLEATRNTSMILMQAAHRCLVALPLLIDKTPIGVLMLTAQDIGAVGDEEFQMLSEVAGNLGFALQYLQKDSAVHFLSHFDPQTGLAKRPLLCERLDRMLARSANHRVQRAVAVFDIERLSVINDSVGRHTGDLLLQHIVDRLRRHFHDTELLAHFGGGTFAIVLEAVGSADELTHRFDEDLAALFGKPFDIGKRQLPVTVKSGLAIYPEDGKDAATLVQNAEAALRNARSTGQRSLHYSAQEHSDALARLALEHKLRIGLQLQQFALHYQPKINVSTRRIEGVEALIRWHDPDAGLVSPAAFLPVLESTGLIVEVGDWVLQQAAADCQYWQDLGLPPVRVAVNIAPLQLRRADFAERFLKFRGLDVEITEGVLLDNSAAEIARLGLLHAAGVKIAIDDFGTGYSSLSRLSDFPIDTLKIDRTFIKKMSEAPSGRTLVATIISLARSFEMTVVAEGVETAEQLEALRELGCDQSQGYLHSKPVTRDEISEILKSGKPPYILPAAGGEAHRRT